MTLQSMNTFDRASISIPNESVGDHCLGDADCECDENFTGKAFVVLEKEHRKYF